MSRRFLAAAAALLVVVACTPDQGSTTTTPVTSPPSTGLDASVPPTTTTTPPTTLPTGTEDLPEEVRVELAELIALTEEVRGLEFIEAPNVVVVTPDELAERVREQLEEDLEDLPADEALYRLLGLIDAETDLTSLYMELYSEQVAGFYDGEVGELVVPMADEGFTAVQRATLVHELTHALTDQHFDFHTYYVELLDSDRYDEASAYQALIEGDAVLAELMFLRGLTPEEQGEFFAESFGVDTTVFDQAPRFIRDALIFPYDSGFIFVDHLSQAGGLAAVGDAYGDPPVSTEQILDPTDFPADAPVVVELPPLTIDGYELEYQSTWGEQGFTLMFDQFLSAATSATASSGWGGDTYQILFDGTEVIMVLRYRGDSLADAQELGAALQEYAVVAMAVGDEPEDMEGGVAFQDEDHIWIRTEGSDVYMVASSDEGPFADVIAQILPADTPDTTDTTGG